MLASVVNPDFAGLGLSHATQNKVILNLAGIRSLYIAGVAVYWTGGKVAVCFVFETKNAEVGSVKCIQPDVSHPRRLCSWLQ